MVKKRMKKKAKRLEDIRPTNEAIEKGVALAKDHAQMAVVMGQDSPDFLNICACVICYGAEIKRLRSELEKERRKHT